MTIDYEAGSLIDDDLLDPAHVSSAPAKACCCAFGWIRQFAGFARSWSGASSPEPVIRLRQGTLGAVACALRGVVPVAVR
jgi:hypothetical protein